MSLTNLERTLMKHNARLEKIERHFTAEQQKQVQRALLDQYTKMFDRAQAYANVIILAGYAGAFTVWSNTRPALSSKLNITIALCLGLSLVAFVGWEVFGMIKRACINERARALINHTGGPENFLASMQEFERKQSEESVKLQPYWYAVLAATIGPALIALGLLFYNYIVFLIA